MRTDWASAELPNVATAAAGAEVRCVLGHSISSRGGARGLRLRQFDPQGPVGAAQQTILLNALAIMLAIVVPTIAATLGCAWWFRESNPRARFLPDWAYSGRIELVVWSIPTLVILFLGGITWIASHELDPARPPRAGSGRSNVSGRLSRLEMALRLSRPRGREREPARCPRAAGPLLLTSASVMNAFFVPQLGSMIYTMNGMTTRLNLESDREGDFYGRSTQFSGDGFPGMQFMLRAVSTDAFEAWSRAARDAAAMLDRDEYANLTKQSMSVRPPHIGLRTSTCSGPSRRRRFPRDRVRQWGGRHRTSRRGRAADMWAS